MPGAWYTYPMDSIGGGYGEILDPVCQSGNCNYLKPDTNIAVPDKVPITALGSGYVTDVHDYGKSGGGLSTTIKLDTPINDLAKYESYNYLGSSKVYVGQAIQKGQEIGKAGSPYGINMAFALSGDPRWGGPSFKYNAAGDPRLDPRQVLGGGTPTSTSSGSPGFITGLTEHIFVFLIALVVIIVGFIIIARPAAQAGIERGAFL